MWKVDEGVAVSIGGGVNDLAEMICDVLESHGGIVRRAARRLIVKVPQDYDFFRFSGKKSFFGRDHVDFGHGSRDRWVVIGGWGGGN